MNIMRCAAILFALFLTGIGFSDAKVSDELQRPNILFLISDDHSANDLGSASSNGPRTPVLDQLAKSGARFTNAYALSPQCSPSRSAMLTGRSPHATGTSRLHSTLTKEHDTVIDALKRAGYFVGAFQKVHLGENFQSRWQFYGDKNVPFDEFFKKLPAGKPFFLSVGFDDPHRPYKSGTISPAHDPASIKVRAYLPDTDSIRKDLADYYDEISRMDSDVGRVLSVLDSRGFTKNTMIVFVGDNGMPFPGAKGSLYNDGVNVPLIVRWPDHIKAGQTRNEVVSLADLVPTWLEVAGVSPLPKMEGESLIPILAGKAQAKERAVFFERNWHDNLDLIRGVRSEQYLLIQNFRSEIPYPPTLDLEASPSWLAIQEFHKQGKLVQALEERYFKSPRPEVELYNVEEDPYQMKNLAADPSQANTIKKLQQLLSDWMISTNDFLQPPIPPKRGPFGEIQ